MNWSLLWRLLVAASVVLASMGYIEHGAEHGKPGNYVIASVSLLAVWVILFRYSSGDHLKDKPE